MVKKISILVVYMDTMGGVGFFRSTQPHEQLLKQYSDEFNVKFAVNPDFNNVELFSMYDIIHFHKGVFPNQNGFFKILDFCKENGIVTIVDIDDYWALNSHHPQYPMFLQRRDDIVIKQALQKCDYVTTTTDLFGGKIRPFNKNVRIFPNTIDPEDKRFKTEKEPCDKLRIGLIMGSSHKYDIETTQGFVGKLPRGILDKVCFILCGYDLRGKVKQVDKKTGQVLERDIYPQESVWFEYEKMITNNYQIISPQYKGFLKSFLQNVEYPDAVKEGYVRRWTLPMDKYYQHYNHVDVLLAPLEETEFNRVKSNLKMVECAFSRTAFVGSDFGPYTIDSKNAFKKGGEIDYNGNCVLIDKNRAHKDWAKTIEKFVKNPDLVKMLQENLYNDYKEKYDLKNVTKQRADFYKEITQQAVKQ